VYIAWDGLAREVRAGHQRRLFEGVNVPLLRQHYLLQSVEERRVEAPPRIWAIEILDAAAISTSAWCGSFAKHGYLLDSRA
jgi:hypothetical protein